jgi:hypothetical protein
MSKRQGALSERAVTRHFSWAVHELAPQNDGQDARRTGRQDACPTLPVIALRKRAFR